MDTSRDKNSIGSGSGSVKHPVCALVHSPLVGPDTWQPVAAVLAESGYDVQVPELRDETSSSRPFWEQHVASAVDLLAAGEGPLILVGHSGAGPLLPLIDRALDRPVAGTLFVDAVWPHDGLSRLAIMRREDAAWVDRLEAALRAGGRFPAWTDADLAPHVPDPERRRRLLAGVRPRALPFFEEPIPLPAGWPFGPVAYVQFTTTYDYHARQARAAGRAVRRLDGGHFHMLVDATAVAGVIVELF